MHKRTKKNKSKKVLTIPNYEINLELYYLRKRIFKQPNQGGGTMRRNLHVVKHEAKAMKKRLRATPNAAVLERFKAWVGVLQRPTEECLSVAFDMYYHDKAGRSSFKADGNGKTFFYDMDVIIWENLKRYAKDECKHDRDLALSTSMHLFVKHYDNKLSEVL